MGKEKNFENRIKRWLENNDAWFVKFFANAMTRSGIPDILVCLKGRFIGIEVKAENGVPSDLQKRHLTDLNLKGGIGILAYPSGWDDLKKLLEEVINEPYLDIKNYINCEGYIKYKR